MIPDFDENGNLPEGIHETTIKEFKARFVYGIRRKQLFEKMEKLMNDLKSAGCKAIYIDGSFVTIKRLPGDYDACWDDDEITYADIIKKIPPLADVEPPRRLQQEVYGADIFPVSMIEINTGLTFLQFFQQDENGNPKGIIKINL